MTLITKNVNMPYGNQSAIRQIAVVCAQQRTRFLNKSDFPSIDGNEAASGGNKRVESGLRIEKRDLFKAGAVESMLRKNALSYAYERCKVC